MSLRFATYWCVWCVLASSSVAMGAGDEVEPITPNGAVAVEASTPARDNETEKSDAPQADDVGAGLLRTPTSMVLPGEPSEATPTSPHPDEQTKTLGTPNGFLSARPIADDATAAEAESPNDLLAQFDPRRNDLLRVVGSLVIVVALIFVLRAVMRRAGGGAFGGSRPSGVLLVHGRYPIARGQHLVLLQIDRRILLLHQTGTAMNTLCEFDDPNEVATLLARIESGARDGGKQSRTFQATLNQFAAEHDNVRDLTRSSRTRPEVSSTMQSQQSSRGFISRLLDRNRSNVVDLTRAPHRSGYDNTQARRLMR